MSQSCGILRIARPAIEECRTSPIVIPSSTKTCFFLLISAWNNKLVLFLLMKQNYKIIMYLSFTCTTKKTHYETLKSFYIKDFSFSLDTYIVPFNSWFHAKYVHTSH